MMSAASLSARDAFCSPCAAITYIETQNHQYINITTRDNFCFCSIVCFNESTPNSESARLTRLCCRPNQLTPRGPRLSKNKLLLLSDFVWFQYKLPWVGVFGIFPRPPPLEPRFGSHQGGGMWIRFFSPHLIAWVFPALNISLGISSHLKCPPRLLF